MATFLGKKTLLVDQVCTGRTSSSSAASLFLTESSLEAYNARTLELTCVDPVYAELEQLYRLILMGELLKHIGFQIPYTDPEILNSFKLRLQDTDRTVALKVSQNAMYKAAKHNVLEPMYRRLRKLGVTMSGNLINNALDYSNWS